MPTECCRHIRTTGRRCNMNALRGKALCFYHDRTRLRHKPPQRREDTAPILHPMRTDALGQADPIATAPHPQPITFEFPVLEDRESIQVAASMIVAALGRNQLDGKRAATMLYGLQVATAVTEFDIYPEDRRMMMTEAFNTPDGDDLSVDADPCSDDDDPTEENAG